MTKGFTHESPAAVSIEWYTPPWIFEVLGLTFDLDVCAPPGGLPWIPATRSFSKADDGLSQDWRGRVWCNPPYGRETAVWLARMNEHRNGVSLVFSRTDCAWFHDIVAKADALLFLRGRLRFVDGAKMTGGSGSTTGSMLVAWGTDNADALFAMDLCGHGQYVGLR